MSYLPDSITGFIKEFRGEWPRSYSCTISLHDTIDISDFVGADAKTGTCTSTYRIGRGNEGIGPKIHIEQRSLSTLAEHTFSITQQLIDFMFRINDVVLSEIFYSLHPFLFYFSDIIAEVH